MNDSPATTGKPLDTADGPGKADAEIGAEEFETAELKESFPESDSLQIVATVAEAGESDRQGENPPKVVADEGQPGG